MCWPRGQVSEQSQFPLANCWVGNPGIFLFIISKCLSHQRLEYSSLRFLSWSRETARSLSFPRLMGSSPIHLYAQISRWKFRWPIYMIAEVEGEFFSSSYLVFLYQEIVRLMACVASYLKHMARFHILHIVIMLNNLLSVLVSRIKTLLSSSKSLAHICFLTFQEPDFHHDLSQVTVNDVPKDKGGISLTNRLPSCPCLC